MSYFISPQHNKTMSPRNIFETVLDVNYSLRKKKKRELSLLIPKDLDLSSSFLFPFVMFYQCLKSSANKNLMQYAKNREGNLGVTVCFHYLHLGTQPRGKELKNLVQSAASYRAEVEHLRLMVKGTWRAGEKNSPRNSDIRSINVTSRRRSDSASCKRSRAGRRDRSL